MNSKEIIAALGTLSQRERAHVAGALSALGEGASPDSGVRPDGLLEALAGYTGQSSRSLRVRMAYKSFAKKVPEAHAFITKLCAMSENPDRVRVFAEEVCIRALAFLLRAHGIYSVSMMLQSIDKLPEAVDICFPGYRAAGLLGFILDRKRIL